MGRTIVALTAMVSLGVLLAILNVFTSRRDLALATGPQGAAQRAWLIDAADRPDVAQFFKKLPHPARVAMARAVGRYDDAPLAKLCGILLADFDAEARAGLAGALKRIAAAHPEAVAAQLKQKGSFQTLAVSDALRTQGAKVLPGVVAMLDDADARPAAVAYLVRAGPAAVPPLLPRLRDANKDVRLAVADALGGLRAQDAVAPLLKALDANPPAERPGYLTAIAAVGDPATERLLSSILDDPQRPIAERTAVTLGLGRIGSPQAVRLLWRYAPTDEPLVASAAFAALAVVGDSAFEVKDAPPLLRVRLAGLVPGTKADAVLRAGLAEPATRLAAVVAAKDRSSLFAELAALLPSARNDGELAYALVASLASSPEGKRLLDPYRGDPSLGGFIQRAT